MKVFIIEDEAPAARRLLRMLDNLQEGIEVVQQADSVESAVNYLQSSPAPDLVFMDIQLADGISFDIFEQVRVTAPVIFTTAFDQYTLKAFKVNSIDYLLKPIDEKDLQQAIEKYHSLHPKPVVDFSEKMRQLIQEMNQNRYRERLLIKRGQQLSYIKTDQTAYCYADGKLCFAVDFSGSRFLLESNLGQLEEQLEPQKFFRINRHLLLHIESIKKVHQHLGGRLKVETSFAIPVETIVSRERVNGFKEWLGR